MFDYGDESLGLVKTAGCWLAFFAPILNNTPRASVRVLTMV